MKKSMSQKGNKNEIACDISALSKGEMEKVMSISKEIFAATKCINELKDGYELTLENSSSMLITKLAEFSYFDSICCPFIKHSIVLESFDGGLRFQLTGKPLVKEYILGELKREIPLDRFDSISWQSL